MSLMWGNTHYTRAVILCTSKGSQCMKYRLIICVILKRKTSQLYEPIIGGKFALWWRRRVSMYHHCQCFATRGHNGIIQLKFIRAQAYTRPPIYVLLINV